MPRSLTAAEIARLDRSSRASAVRRPPVRQAPRGAAGDAGVRILRIDCATGNCTAECADDEILLNAYCSPGRTPATYPTEHSAPAAPAGRGRVEVVAACVKGSRR